MTKIQIKELEKTQEYIDREWSTVLHQRHHLLNSSDWTQLPDVKLTTDCRSAWVLWRERVRSVSRKVDSLEDASLKLEQLEKSQPKNEYGPDPIDDEIINTKNILDLTLATDAGNQALVDECLQKLFHLFIHKRSA